MNKRYIVIGEDRDVICIDDVRCVTFGNPRKYGGDIEVRFWFDNFNLDYVMRDEEKEKLREVFKDKVVAVIGGKRNRGMVKERNKKNSWMLSEGSE